MRVTTALMGLSCGLLLSVGCGGSDATSCDITKVTGTSNKFATNSLLLPLSDSYAIDIDGDGRKDNALKMLLSPLAAQNVDLQGGVNSAVAAGEAVLLADITASDLTTAACVKTTLNAAVKPANPPKYNGTDTFTIDTKQTATPLAGSITGGTYTTTLPKDMGPKDADVPTITLQLAIAGGNLALKLMGAHVQGTVNANGIMSGQIHGVILQKDIDGSVIPAVADLVTAQIHKDPTGSSSKLIIQLFEDMTNSISKNKCAAKAADCCATNAPTCKILPEEVKASPVVGGLLAPDVGTHDASGAWKPAKGNTKDAMSVGLGFTAVKASF